MKDPSHILSLVASSATVLSTAIAVIQTIGKRKLKRDFRRETWLSIATTQAMLSSIDQKLFDEVYMGLSNQFRSLLLQAISLESKFTPDIIKAWRRVGKLTSDWQEKQARVLLDTRGLVKFKTGETDAKFSNWDQLEPRHREPETDSSGRPVSDIQGRNDRGE
jgi:hypothetical protein